MKELELLLATSNKGKLAEWLELLRDVPVKLHLAQDVGHVEEDAADYEGNALIKAREFSKFTHLPVLAEDSGLEVKSLGGLPGVRSARIVAGSDADRVSWLLNELKDKDDRRARFVACAVILAPDRENYLSFTGICEGEIVRKAQGSGGFGYDPVFLPFLPDKNLKTFAEMSRCEKQKISHRGECAKKIKKYIYCQISQTL